MKRIEILTAFAIMIMLAGCGDKTEYEDNIIEDISDSSLDTQIDDTSISSNSVSESEVADDTEPEVDYMIPAIIVNENIIYIGDYVDDKLLGECTDEQAIMPNGDKCFLVGDTYIYTRANEDKDMIYLIQAGADSEILSGFSIGDTASKLNDIYGDDILSEDNYFEYEHENVVMDIEIEDDVIVYVEIYNKL